MKINTVRLRVMIGWLGMLLPWIVSALIGYIPPSISATWYTNACTTFMIILGSASFLLISYKGYSAIDDVILTLSGIAGIGICLFPCYVAGADKVGTFMINVKASNIAHIIFAVLFFALLSYNSMFLFTKTGGDMTPNKRKRNIIYKICGAGMVLSFAILIVPNFDIKIWLMETIALGFFGISFLTKANTYRWLFCDKPDQQNSIET